MPQQHLPTMGETPTRLDITIESNPLYPERPMKLLVTTRTRLGEEMRSKGYTLVDIEVDFAAEMAKSAVEGYLFGDGWMAPFAAVAHLHRAAREHRIKHGR